MLLRGQRSIAELKSSRIKCEQRTNKGPNLGRFFPKRQKKARIKKNICFHLYFHRKSFIIITQIIIKPKICSKKWYHFDNSFKFAGVRKGRNFSAKPAGNNWATL